MQIPRIHDNGTPHPHLIEEVCAASDAVEAAYQAVKKAAPNPRDYDDIEAATKEHLSRLRKIDSVKSELDELAKAIYEAK